MERAVAERYTFQGDVIAPLRRSDPPRICNRHVRPWSGILRPCRNDRRIAWKKAIGRRMSRF